MTLLSYLDAHIGYSCEKIPNKGEDSWCYSFNERAGLMGVFDGCGGLGAASYAKISGKTGAYLASRAVAGAALEWFSQGSETGVFDMEALKQQMLAYLSVCVKTADTVQSKFRGSMVRLMPTTASMWLMEPEQEPGRLKITSISAGDSRNYILCSSGLMQVSVDDLAGEDAMSNLYNDGAMTNVVSADGRFSLGQEVFSLDISQSPVLLISATDGCFGYLRSPMEFELLLLETLMRAVSADQWKMLLQQSIGEVAGDDQSLSMAAFGFGSFRDMQQALLPRYREMAELSAALGDSTEKRWEVWETYKNNYYCLTEGGAPTRA